MVSAVGRKKRTAARIQRLTEEVPLWAAAAIQRGPSTAAMLNNRTSQKPIARRSSGVVLAGSWFTRIPFRSSERGKIAELVLKNKKAPRNGTPFCTAGSNGVHYRRNLRNSRPIPPLASPSRPSKGSRVEVAGKRV